MYVWIDAVLGYLTTTQLYCFRNNLNWEDWWKKSDKNKMYMVHGKDNITFHSLILPGLLLALEDNYKLPDMIDSTEYLNFNDQKFSKSKGIGMTVLEAVNEFNIDTLRFHLIKNGPEKKDSNFTVEDYIATHNELTNKLGNFVNRTLKYKGMTEIPNGKIDEEIKKKIENVYIQISELMEKIEFREVTNVIMNFLDEANKYYDEQKPWVQYKEDINKFNDIMYTCATMIANISNIIEPFMPKSAAKIREYLQIEKATWDYIEVKPNLPLNNIEVLFTKM